MKNLMNYLTAALFFSLVAFASCGSSDDDDGGTPEDILADKAALLVRGTATLTDVNTPTGATALNWDDFSITYTGGKDGGSYTTSGVPEGGEGVWPASGTWTFNGTTGTKITRENDGVVIDISLSETSDALEMSFNIPDPAAARTSVIKGDWTFSMLFPG